MRARAPPTERKEKAAGEKEQRHLLLRVPRYPQVPADNGSTLSIQALPSPRQSASPSRRIFFFEASDPPRVAVWSRPESRKACARGIFLINKMHASAFAFPPLPDRHRRIDRPHSANNRGALCPPCRSASCAMLGSDRQAGEIGPRTWRNECETLTRRIPCTALDAGDGSGSGSGR